MPLGIYGEWRYKDSRKQYTGIAVSTGDHIGEHPQDLQEEAFWHELTHAILHDMKEKALNDNEDFVTGFSQRLHKAIKSAEFK
jgi:hypothetical protein